MSRFTKTLSTEHEGLYITFLFASFLMPVEKYWPRAQRGNDSLIVLWLLHFERLILNMIISDLFENSNRQ